MRRRGWQRFVAPPHPALALAACIAVFSGAASAEASQRYASVTGAGSACTQAAPCDLPTATGSASGGDEIIVNPGTYTLSANPLFVPLGGSMHGVAGMAKPLIATDAAINVGSATVLSDLRLVTSNTQGLAIGGTNTVAQRLEVTAAGPVACNVFAGALIRDSICVSNSPSSGAVALGSSGNGTAHARNVTAVGIGPGSVGGQSAAGIFGVSPANVFDLKNVIASGTLYDVQAVAPSGSATLTLANSNWATSGTSGTATVTPTGSATNQTGSPLFVNETGGDYRQAAGSPTIDAGVTDSLTGSLDFENEPRPQGAAMDIGADEGAGIGTPPPDPPDITPPETTIDKGPKRKSKSSKASFSFSSNEPGSTFSCKVDRKDFAPCTSPAKYKHLKKGKHTFTVIATDPAKNADPSPAAFKWKVKSKKKRH